MESEQAIALDLVCSRYPGRRPSDYRDDLDEYQSLQFDVAMAYRGMIEDYDHEQQIVYQLLSGMVGVMKSNGAKNVRLEKPRKTIQPRRNRELNIQEIISSLGGDGVVLQQ